MKVYDCQVLKYQPRKLAPTTNGLVIFFPTYAKKIIKTLNKALKRAF